jgi:antitoxin MazE
MPASGGGGENLRPRRNGTGIAERDRLIAVSPKYTLFETYIHGKPMQVAKWGNSLAVRLPAAVVDALQLKEGDEIEIHVADEREFGVSRKPGREELLKRLRAFRGRLPADFKFDRDEANAR